MGPRNLLFLNTVQNHSQSTIDIPLYGNLHCLTLIIYAKLSTIKVLWIETIDIIILIEPSSCPRKLLILSSNTSACMCCQWIMSQLQVFGKNTKYRISCLNFFMLAVWIYICLDINYLRIWITKSVWKNCMKIGFVPVDLTELSYYKNR